MSLNWIRRLFGHSRKHLLKITQTKADQGDAKAQFDLGKKFTEGDGTIRDYVMAAHWYLKAAQQNYAPAQFCLGVILAGGQGTPRDDGQSIRWTRKAAEQGHAGAQHHLGSRLLRDSHNQNGPEAALECCLEAYKWYRLAAAQNHHGSKTAFEGMALRMTREQVIEGDQRAAAFVAV